MADYFYFYKPPPPPLTRPTGLQPLLWLHPEQSGPLQDYRGAGYPTVTGNLEVVTVDGKKYFMLDGSPIYADGVGLAGKLGVSVLMDVKISDLNGQYYGWSYGPGSNSNEAMFDAYNNYGQMFARFGKTGDRISSFSYLLSEVNHMAFMCDWTQQYPLTLLDARDNLIETTQEASMSGGEPWYAPEQRLWICCGQNGVIPFPADSLLRSFPIFGGPLSFAKAREWKNYIASLP
jgi:hypothetical protein